MTATGRRVSRRSIRRSMNGSRNAMINMIVGIPTVPRMTVFGPLEDAEEIEEEVEVPIRPRDEVRRRGIGGLGVARAEQAGVAAAARVGIRAGREVPDGREPDDHRDHDEAHDRVVEHRVGEERLPALLDVRLVLGELLAPLVGAGHYSHLRCGGSRCARTAASIRSVRWSQALRRSPCRRLRSTRAARSRRAG